MKVMLNNILCLIFQVKRELRKPIITLHNLRGGFTVGAPQEDGALLHAPGPVVGSLLGQGEGSVAPAGGGGAELLAAQQGDVILGVVAAARQEPVLGAIMYTVQVSFT